MNRPKLVIGATLVGVVIGVVILLSNPLRRSDATVRGWLLDNVPIGSDVARLDAAAAEYGWRVHGAWRGNDPKRHTGLGGIDGHTVIWVSLGSYRTVFATDLDSFWAFDERGALTGVVIRRMNDAL